MNSSNYPNAIKSIIKESISPYFKNHGFKINGSYYYRINNDYYEVCQLQRNRFNSSINASFTFNIGIASNHIMKIVTCDNIINDNPLFSFNFFNFRFGNLLNLNNLTELDYDVWYILGDDLFQFEPDILQSRIDHIMSIEGRYDHKNPVDLNNIVIHDIDNYILPFFSNNNLDNLIKYIYSKNSNLLPRLYLLYRNYQNNEINTFKNNYNQMLIDYNDIPEFKEKLNNLIIYHNIVV